MIRKNDWPERLAALIESRQNTPFKWGENDCGLFAADAVLALTGTDPAAAIRGTYTNEEGAAAALLTIGANDITEAPDALLSELATPIHPRLATRGDIVLVSNTDGAPMLAVCLGEKCATPGASGLLYNKTTAALDAWRVKFTPYD